MRYRDHALTISKSIDLWSNKLAKLKTENFQNLDTFENIYVELSI